MAGTTLHKPQLGVADTPGHGRSFTYAYLLALMLIAGCMMAAYWVSTSKLAAELDNASVINTAGKQRMLSQRLGLLTQNILTDTDAPQDSALREAFVSAHQTFQQNAMTLRNLADDESASESLKQLYQRPRPIDVSTWQLLILADEFMATTQRVPVDGARQALLGQQLVTLVKDSIIDDLDTVVQQHEDLASLALKNFGKLGLLILVVGLLLLVAEALFIFRPVAKASAHYQSQLETTNQELVEFNFRMSHDLRSPIASCRGLIDIAQEAIQDKDEDLIKELVDRMQAALYKADILIEDIIDVTKTKAVRVEPEVIALRSLVNTTIQGLDTMQGFNDIQFDINISESCAVCVKKFYLQQILENLLSNAIKYSQRADTLRSPAVQVHFHAEGKMCRLTVDDNGLGIPADLTHKAFGMFMRFHPNIAQGSGLGLYLCAQNAKALGGKLLYEMQSPGSRFILTFQNQSRRPVDV